MLDLEIDHEPTVEGAAVSVERLGLCRIKGLLGESDIQAIFAGIEELLDISLESVNVQERARATSVDEKYMLLKDRNPALKSHAYDFFGRLFQVRAAIYRARLQNVVQKLLGSATVVDHVQVRVDDASNDRLLPLHQELGQISERNLTCWCPLVEVGEPMGGLCVVPGSHLRGRRRHRFFPENHNYHGLLAGEYSDADIRRLLVARGDAVLFHPHVYHGSLPNRASGIRWTIVARFNSAQSAPYLRSGQAPLRMPQHIDGFDE